MAPAQFSAKTASKWAMMAKKLPLMFAALVTGSSFAASAEGPIAHWDFAEGRGCVLHDRANGRHGVIRGCTWDSAGLRIDGSGAYVDCGNHAALKPTGDMTLSAWIRLRADTFPDPSTNWTIVDCERYREQGFIFRVNGSDGRLLFRANQPGASQWRYSDAALKNGQSYHVAVTKRRGRVQFHVNGSAGLAFTVKDPATGSLRFSISNAAQSFAG